MSKNIQVSVVDNALVVSFVAAGDMRVMRLDMSHFPTTSVELQEGKDNFTLVMKQGNGAAVEICSFAERKKAQHMLESISNALLQGHSGAGHKKGCWFRKILKIALVLVIILGVIIALGKPHRPVNQGDMSQSSPPVQEGVPTSADSILGK